jgi:hypothetical protein
MYLNVGFKGEKKACLEFGTYMPAVVLMSRIN